MIPAVPTTTTTGTTIRRPQKYVVVRAWMRPPHQLGSRYCG